MLFNSLRFAIFFPVVYVAYLALPHRWQNRMLLIASYVFYASWDWRFLFLILMSTGVDYHAEGVKLLACVPPRLRPRASFVDDRRRYFPRAHLLTHVS